jgi:[NiFe] hydrogenase diaphorase moiety large subunit
MSLGESMMAASKCGLGQSSPTPFLSIMTHFKQEIFAQW